MRERDKLQLIKAILTTAFTREGKPPAIYWEGIAEAIFEVCDFTEKEEVDG